MSRLNVYQSKYSSLQGADLTTLTNDHLARGLYITAHDFSDDKDHVLVGYAEVQITLMPRAEVVSAQVAALRKQIEDEKLRSGMRLLELDRQINSLLCIEGAASEVKA